MMVYMVFLRMLENVWIFRSAPGLIAWLNELNILEGEFNANFGHIGEHLNADISKGRNFGLAGYFFVPSALWLTLQGLTVLQTISFKQGLWAFGCFWFFSCQYIILCQPLLEDVKIFLMLKSLTQVYKRFREAIHHELEIRSGGGITEKNVRFWIKYAMESRKQVERTGQHLKSQVLMSITETILGTSMGIYLTLRFSQAGTLEQNLGFTSTCLFYALLCAVRLYLKVFFAEKVYSEVRAALVFRLSQ